MTIAVNLIMFHVILHKDCDITTTKTVATQIALLLIVHDVVIVVNVAVAVDVDVGVAVVAYDRYSIAQHKKLHLSYVINPQNKQINPQQTIDVRKSTNNIRKMLFTSQILDKSLHIISYIAALVVAVSML